MATSKTIITLMLITLVSVIGTGCSDDSTAPAPAAPVAVDTQPPSFPANLAIDSAAGDIELSWDANTIGDLLGYVITRENQGVVVDLVDAPVNVTSFFDSEAPFGVNLYRVYATDLAGNMSAIASISYVNALSHDVDELVLN